MREPGSEIRARESDSTVAFQNKMASPAGGGITPQDNKVDMNKQVHIHVREDSDSDLERLFDIAMNKGARPLQIPLRMRNLPASFWQPPTMGSKSPSVHSRENSLDNSSGFPDQGSPQPAPPAGHHSRANSCPATLGQTLAVAQQHQNQAHQHLHLRQQSYDVGGNEDPLPPGWEMAKTPDGQHYFMNHITKTTQWEDPRKAIQMEMLSQLNGTASPRSAASPVPQAQGEPQHLGPLTDGWEQSQTPQGEVYFIHHPTKKTTWYDPRIPISQQHTVPLKHLPGAGDLGGFAGNKRQHQARLDRLQMERIRLAKRQQELAQLAQRQQHDRPRSGSQENMAVTQAQEMMMRHSLSEGQTTNIDPFIGQQGGTPGGTAGEVHNRQESADSGLGMGSNCNLGIIQEDMVMENMDTDLDTTLTETSMQQGGQSGSGSQAGGSNGMETEELIPTLPELGDELSNDYIQTILNPNKVEDSLTWL